VQSLDASFQGMDDFGLRNVVAYSEVGQGMSLREQVLLAQGMERLAQLSPIERQVICLSYLYEIRVSEIAELLEVTSRSVYKIRTKALRELGILRIETELGGEGMKKVNGNGRVPNRTIVQGIVPSMYYNGSA